MKNIDLMARVGLWFLVPIAVLAGVFGVASHSWGTFFAFLPIILFFAVWHASAFASRSPIRPVRIAGLTVNVACGLVAVASMALAAEQLYAVNGSSYPSWLATADLGTVKERRDLLSLADHCKHPGATVFVKDNGLVLVRCGGISMLGTETYLAHLEGY